MGKFFLAFVLLDQIFQEFEMCSEGIFASLGSPIIGKWFSACKGFFYEDVFRIFQVPQVRSQIAVCDVKQFFEGIEVKPLIDHQDGHDAESDHIFKCFVVNAFHLIDRIGNTSWIRRSHAKSQIPKPNKEAHKQGKTRQRFLKPTVRSRDF